MASHPLARKLLSFHLHLDQRACADGLRRALLMARRLHDLIGDNTNESEEGREARMHKGDETCTLLTEGNAGTLVQARHTPSSLRPSPSPPRSRPRRHRGDRHPVQAVLEAVDLDMTDAERAFALLQACRAAPSGPRTDVRPTFF